MSNFSATSAAKACAAACANIAFIKYWGNRDHRINLPSNGSISMNLAMLKTVTHVEFDKGFTSDELIINDVLVTGPGLFRMQRFLDQVRRIAEVQWYARVYSQNNFPMSAGLASSASGYAALSLASTKALNLHLNDRELSSLARLGSGSAARSIPGGFVEWYASETHEGSFAASFADPDYWDLVDVIVIVQDAAKETASSQGHVLADTSPIQPVRTKGASGRLAVCRQAILERDFSAFSEVVELDSMLMHAAMMTSTPALIYWEPVTLQIIKSVKKWRGEGLQVCSTIDAGANVHLLCLTKDVPEIQELVRKIPGVLSLIISQAGGPAQIIEKAP